MMSCAGMYSTIAKCTGRAKKCISRAGSGVLGGKQDGEVGLVGGAVQSVRYQIIEPQGNEIGSGR
jgi:hypothetical protein